MKYRLTGNLLSLLFLCLLSPGTDSFASSPTTIALSNTEQQWLQEHPVIRLGVDPAWPPFDFIDRQGVHRGMAADFLQLLAQRLGVSVEMVPDIGWNQALEQARDRSLDLVSLSQGTPERLEFMTYTDVVTSVPWSIVTQKDYREIDGLNDLAGLEVALVEGYAIEELIQADYPGIKIRQVASSLDGLRAVASGQVKAMAESLAVASHLITENNLANLRIAADSGLDVMELGFGVRSDWPQLVELLNRAIRSLSRDEVRAIYTRWAPLAATPVDDLPPTEQRLWWFVAAGLIVLVLLIPVLLQRLSGHLQTQWFSSAAVRRIGAVAVALFLGMVMVLAWYSLEKVNDQLRDNLGNQLTIINNSVHQSLLTWFESRQGLVVDLSSEPGVLDATAALLAAPRNPQALRIDPAMQRLRTLLKPRMDRMNARGIFIIAPDRVSIASMRDANLGTRNLIAQQRSKLMDRAFAGKTVFIPPIVSDVPLRDQHGQMVQHAPTMFFATPLRDANGEVVAVFTVRFEPAFELTRITETGRPGESGETYAIDENGRLLTVSRFEESLIGAGIATETGTGDTSIRGLRIADPGGNLLSGHVPGSGRSEWPLTLMASEATHGRSGMDVAGYRDYRGIPVIGAWLWSEDLGIGLTTEIDVDEALAPYLTLRNLVISALGVTALLALALTGLSVWLGDRAKARLERLVEERTRELKKLVQAVEQSPLSVVITDVDGKIEHVNPTFTRVTGYQPDEVIGKNPRILKSGETSPDQYASLWQTILDGKVWRGEIRNRKKSGEIYWSSTSIAPVTDDTGTVTHFVAMTDDITAQKEAAEALAKAKEAADAANQAKSAFLANMSHELRTPMNAILGYSEMLIEEAEDLEQEEFIPDLKKINQAGSHLLSLINDVLDLSKIESGKMEAFAEEINLDRLIDEVSATAQPLMGKNRNKLSIERREQLGNARQDLTKLRQMLFNLLSNAAKFTHEGTVTLHVDRTEQSGEAWLTFAISDTGIGIAEDKIEHVFKEFAQADDSTTRHYGGTGLGLAITRRFCELLGGDLAVRSEPGKGSTFTIRVPAILPGSEPRHPPADTSPAMTGTELEPLREARPGSTILVIDDDPEACEIIERYLVKDGYAVVTAGSGEQGLRLAHEIQPAVITLDVMMPSMDGWSVLAALKADPVLRKIPVIMLTMIDDRTRGYSLGAVDYLTKPVDREQLHKALSRYYCTGDTCSVLLIEDDPETRELMARALEKAGWAVSEAGNGQEALDIMGTSQPHLILLDLMMPVMDGFDFLTAMRAQPEWQHIPVIVITARDLTEADRDRLAGRVEAVLEKSAYTREQLLERVSEAVAMCNINS
jgi:PAS domain S-box-containing protein